MVDLGSKRTLLHKNLVGLGAVLEAEWVEVRCVQGDIYKYPIVLQMQICINERSASSTEL